VRTQVVRVDPAKGPWPELAEMGRIVRDGGLVAFPTETVYGIAVNLRDEAAMRRLVRLKGRAEDKPITVHLADADELSADVRSLPRPAWRLARRFWPGPLTLVVPDRAGRPTGYRVPDHPACREFLRRTGCRVGGTSANPSGSEPATTAARVLEHFDGVLDAVIDGGECRHGTASTVVRADVGGWKILRQGVVPEAEIREATAKLLLFVCSGNRCRSPLAAAFAADLLARRHGVDRTDLVASGYRVESAGTDCIRGQPPTPEAEAAARRYACDLTGHRSRPLTPTLVEEADEILVMTGEQRASILEFAPDAAGRVRLLDLAGRDVADPYGGGAAVYERTAERIHRILEQRLDDL